MEQYPTAESIMDDNRNIARDNKTEKNRQYRERKRLEAIARDQDHSSSSVIIVNKVDVIIDNRVKKNEYQRRLYILR